MISRLIKSGPSRELPDYHDDPRVGIDGAASNNAIAKNSHRGRETPHVDILPFALGLLVCTVSLVGPGIDILSAAEPTEAQQALLIPEVSDQGMPPKIPLEGQGSIVEVDIESLSLEALPSVTFLAEAPPPVKLPELVVKVPGATQSQGAAMVSCKEEATLPEASASIEPTLPVASVEGSVVGSGVFCLSIHYYHFF